MEATVTPFTVAVSVPLCPFAGKAVTVTELPVVEERLKPLFTLHVADCPGIKE